MSYATVAVFSDGTPCPEVLSTEQAARYFQIDTNSEGWRERFESVRMKTGIKAARIGRGLMWSRRDIDDAFRRLTQQESR